jgi:hypothetical protein
MAFNKKKLLLSLGLSAASAVASAQGLIENNSELRDDLNWLNQQGVIHISTSTWPLSGDEVQRALSHANINNRQQQQVIDSVYKILKLQDSRLKLDLSAQSGSNPSPQAFAEDRDAEYQAALEYNAGGQNWDVKLRVNAESEQIIKNGDKVNVEGSYIAGKLWNQWLAFGQIPTWWGPGHDGSLIRGDASRPVTGLTLQRAQQQAFESKWLSWIGPWQYQLFAGQLHDYSAVPDAKLVGLRLTAQPLPYLELGASRSFQIAGKGQPNSFKSYWNAFIGKDNTCDAAGCVNESNASNQLAGLDLRLNLNALVKVPVGVYAQMIGEDESGGFPSRKMYLAGADFSSSLKKMPYQVYVEWSDTRTSGEVLGYSYNHHQYTDGYYQDGYPLGHALGGDGQMYSLGGNIRIDPLNRVAARLVQAKVNQSSLSINQAYPAKDDITALDVTWTNTFSPDVAIKLKGWLSDSDLNGHDAGASIGLELSLDKLLLGK